MEQSVPKRRHIKFRRRGITQKKTYNISKFHCHGFTHDRIAIEKRLGKFAFTNEVSDRFVYNCEIAMLFDTVLAMTLHCIAPW
jgi:hypothetical protein